MLIELDTEGRTRMPVRFQRFEAGTSPAEERTSEPIPEINGLRVNNAFVFGPFKLFVAERLLKRDEEALPIGGRALDLLTVLVERAGEVISQKELIARAWPDVVVEKANLRVHIASLRKVLRDGLDGARYISNVAGRGYCFVAAVARPRLEQASPQARQVAGVGTKDGIAAARGQADVGIELLRTALGALHSEHHNILLTVFAGALTQGLLKAGQFDEALVTVNGAIGQATSLGATFHVAELLRLKAEVLAAAPQKDAAAALDCLRQSLRFARDQSALAYELRSATTLARLLSEEGQREEARSILAPVYDRFAEEYQTPDLRDARALLASLA
jgi:DNA-binding winged helix-turn-helix (wHTH) protein